jgi:hypothetical protein
MANEITIRYRASAGEGPESVRAAWREQPPPWLSKAGFKLVDETYRALVYRADVTTSFQRITMFGMAKSLYTLTLTFDSDGSVGTVVTIDGKAPEKAIEAIRADAAAAGGGSDPRVA